MGNAVDGFAAHGPLIRNCGWTLVALGHCLGGCSAGFTVCTKTWA